MSNQGAKNLERKVKKEIWGQSFLIGIFYPKEFIEFGRDELARLGYGHWEQRSFGFEGSAYLQDVYRLNIHTRFASRILIRIAQIRAGASEQLFSEVSKVPFFFWVPFHSMDRQNIQDNPDISKVFDLRVFLKHSLVHHQGKAEKSFLKALEKVLKEFDISTYRIGETFLKDLSEKKFSQNLDQEENRARIYLHLEGNKGVVSIDSSGVSLQKRGYRIYPGPAPIAEHKAAALVERLYGLCPQPELVVDGMTGSGTLLFESILRLNQLPPGRSRTFQYQTWISYRSPPDFYWRKQNQPQARIEVSSDLPRVSPEFIAIDQASDSLKAFQKNLTQFQHLYNFQILGNTEITNLSESDARSRSDISDTSNNKPLDLTLRIIQKDLFHITQKDVSIPSSLWILLNPPYDIRLESNLKVLYAQICQWVGQWSGAFVSVLVPKGTVEYLFDQFPQPLSPIVFSHGGREILQLILHIP